MAYRYDPQSCQGDGFPDEFGRELFAEETMPVPHNEKTAHSPLPFWGYVTPSWFGPFLLAPSRRLGRGWC